MAGAPVRHSIGATGSAVNAKTALARKKNITLIEESAGNGWGTDPASLGPRKKEKTMRPMPSTYAEIAARAGSRLMKKVSFSPTGRLHSL